MNRDVVRRIQDVLLGLLATGALGTAVYLAVVWSAQPLLVLLVAVNVVGTVVAANVSLGTQSPWLAVGPRAVPGAFLYLVAAAGLPVLLWFGFGAQGWALTVAAAFAVLFAVVAVARTGLRWIAVVPIWTVGGGTFHPARPVGRLSSSTARAPAVLQATAAAAVGSAVAVTASVPPSWWAPSWLGPSRVALGVLAGLVTLVLMGPVLRWLTVTPPLAGHLEERAREARRAAGDVAGASDRRPSHDDPSAIRATMLLTDLQRCSFHDPRFRQLQGELERLRPRVPPELQEEVDEALRSRWPVPGRLRVDPLCTPMWTAEAFDVQVLAAERTGAVLDESWPRVRTVLPAPERREVRTLERAVAFHRLLASAGLAGTVVQLAVVPLGGGVGPALGTALLAVLCVGAGRRALTVLFRRRAELVEVYRVAYLTSVRAQLPESSAGLVALGGLLSGVDDDHPLVRSESTTPPGPDR